MAENTNEERFKVNHLHSEDVDTVTKEPKAPEATELGVSEMALNLAKGVETLYVKNKEGEIVATPLGTRGYDALRKQLEEIAQIYSIYGMARVNGETSAAGTIFFGEEANFKQIANVAHMGLVDNTGKLYKRCANGRIDKAVDGTDLAIDGSDGDVLLYIDRTVYVCRFTDTVEGVASNKEINVFAIGLAPFTIYGHAAKALKPFAFSPQFTVNGQLTKTNNGDKVNGVEDVRACAHSIYNPNIAGSYSAVYNWFKQTYKANGNGFPSQYVSSMNSIWQAQCKNPDQTTNRPYMGGYYEFTELFLMLMYLENKTLYHQELSDFGCGCTLSRPAENQTYFGDADMSGNSGVMYVQSDGTKTFSRLMSTVTIANGSSFTNNPIGGLCGSGWYGFTQMLETQRVLNDIAKAGLVNKIWTQKEDNENNKAVVFEYNDEGNIIVSAFTNEEFATGANMTPNKRYFQVRNTKNCQGMADGVMTAVVNTYIRLDFADGTTVAGVPHTGGYAVYKLSRAIYRGMSVSFEGMFTQMQGCHYVRVHRNEDDKVVSYFIAAEDVDSVPAQPAASIEYFGDENAELAMEANLTKKVMSHGPLPANHASHYGWAGKADYNMSLFCLVDDDLEGGGTKLSGSISTKECSFLWNYASWSNGDAGTLNSNGTPAKGRKCVNAVVPGCYAGSGYASARTVSGGGAVSHGSVSFAGRFSLPHLTL